MSAFKRRQELLIHGYVKENYEKAAVSHALLSLIAQRHSEDDIYEHEVFTGEISRC